MGFFYSDSTGLMETDFAKPKTEEEAFLVYYIQELALAQAMKEAAERDLKKSCRRLDELDEQFGYLILKYPEEFI